MKRKYIIGSVIIIVFIIWLSFSIKKTLTPYVTINEAKKLAAVVQIKGRLVEKERIIEKQGQLQFLLKDEENTVIEIIYNNAKPLNFEYTNDIVCIGRYRDNRFYADKLLTKCPSKYTSTE
jgi:cytochrome c-type biogenesis protein CcmE